MSSLTVYDRTMGFLCLVDAAIVAVEPNAEASIFILIVTVSSVLIILKGAIRYANGDTPLR